MALDLASFKKNQKARQKNNNQDPAIFPFWNMEFGHTSVVRFLPFEDEVSGGFWTERKLVPMEFTDPENPDNTLKLSAPSLEMYTTEERCPLLDMIRALYKEAKELKDNGEEKQAEIVGKIASTHWVNATFYYQGFVVKPGISEENPPENPIRIFPIMKKLHKNIYNAIMDEEEPFDRLPCGNFTMDDIQAFVDGDLDDDQAEKFLDKLMGYNYRLKKTKQGDWPEWTNSSFMRTEPSSLDEDQLSAIAEHGLHDLREKLPTRPTEEQYEVMREMMQVSIDRAFGRDEGLWNPEWEQPSGMKPFRKREAGDNSGGDSNSTSSKLKSKLDKGSSGKSSGGSALDRLKSRQRKPEEEPEEHEETSTEDQTDSQPEEKTEEAPKANKSDALARLRAKSKKSEPEPEDSEGDEEDSAPADDSKKPKKDPNDVIANLRSRVKK